MTIQHSQHKTSAKGTLERDLAQRLGVDQRTIAAYRKDGLLENEHWTIHAGHVTYTDAGVSLVEKELRLVRALDHSITDPPSAPSQEVDRGATGILAKKTALLVVRIYPNPTWVRCERSDGSKVDVQVPMNRGMRRGLMLFNCVHHPTVPGRLVWRPRPLAFKHGGGHL